MDKSKVIVNEEKSEKSLFIQRVIAFFIDVMLVSMIASLIATPFVDSEAITKLSNSSTEVAEKYLNGEITNEAYFSETMTISYQMARKNGVVSLITIFLEILYFVVYQFYNGGQTIGKKLLKIRVVSVNDELTMNQIIFRSLIINSILLEMLSLCFIIFVPKNIYMYLVLFFEGIQYIIVIISCFMIMFSKDGRGLHDKIARTAVIRTNMVKELEVCEN